MELIIGLGPHRNNDRTFHTPRTNPQLNVLLVPLPVVKPKTKYLPTFVQTFNCSPGSEQPEVLLYFSCSNKNFPLSSLPSYQGGVSSRETQLRSDKWGTEECYFLPPGADILTREKITNNQCFCPDWMYFASSSLSKMALEFDWHARDCSRKFLRLTPCIESSYKSAAEFKDALNWILRFNFHMILIVNCPRWEGTGCGWWDDERHSSMILMWNTFSILNRFSSSTLSNNNIIFTLQWLYLISAILAEKAHYSVKINLNQLHFTNC